MFNFVSKKLTPSMIYLLDQNYIADPHFQYHSVLGCI